MRVGTVQLLRRFPLRSAAGDEPASALLGAAGLSDDRRWVAVDAGGQVLTGKRLPALAGVRASVDGGVLSAVVAGAAVRGPALERALSELAGGPVTVRDDSGEGSPHRDGAAVHLVSAGADRAPGAPTGCDPGTRANVVLDLAGPARPGDERSWAGRRLRVGEAELLITRTPRQCLGVYGDVVVPGVVRVGDEAVLLG